MYNTVIIKSKVKGQPNWSGKEFSEHAAKLYFSFEEASQALSSYWFNDFAKDFNGGPDGRVISIVTLSEKEKIKLLTEGAVRL